MLVKLKNITGYGIIGTIENHFGFPFIIQPDRSLICDVTGALAKVALMEIANGRIEKYEAKPEAELDSTAAEKDSDQETEDKKRSVGRPKKE